MIIRKSKIIYLAIEFRFQECLKETLTRKNLAVQSQQKKYYKKKVIIFKDIIVWIFWKLI